MTRHTLVVAVLGTAVFLPLRVATQAAAQAPSSVSPAPSSGSARQRSVPNWSYKVELTCRKVADHETATAYVERLQAALNTEGRAGWELTSTMPVPDPLNAPNSMCVMAMFKRAEQ